MKRVFIYEYVFILPLLFAGCASVSVSREIFSGRQALRLDKPTEAVRHFEAASHLDPDYVTGFTRLNIGVWTYLGRAYYESGEKDKALASLNRAKATFSNDHLARVFLGLVQLSQNGSSAGGVSELQAGLEGLAGWLRTLPGTSREGKFWDPGKYIANRIAQTGALLRVERPDWEAVRANVLWIARELDDEIRAVKEQMEQDKRQTEN
jgi:tetratricopeptide (TPR) repeat protein